MWDNPRMIITWQVHKSIPSSVLPSFKSQTFLFYSVGGCDRRARVSNNGATACFYGRGIFRPSPLFFIPAQCEEFNCSITFFPFHFHSHRFTKIEVDPQVKTPEGKYYDVLFIGTGKKKKKNLNSFFSLMEIF